MSVWFPTFSSCLKAIALPFWIFPIWIIAFYWLRIAAYVSFIMTEGRITVAISILVAAFLSPFILLPFLHHLLFGKSRAYRPIWMPGRASLWEGLSALGTTLLSICTTTFIITPFVDLGTYYNYKYYGSYRSLHRAIFSAYSNDLLAYCALGIWLVASAYAYHWHDLIYQKISSSSKILRTKLSQ